MRARVLVLCTGNSCRSQMAEGYLRHFLGGHAEVFSAGVEAHGMNPRAIAVMEEDGVSISAQRSKTVDRFLGQEFDHVITVCDSARERCPWFSTRAARWHQDFPDPARATGSDLEIMDRFREVRDMVKDYCRLFAERVVTGSSGTH